MDRFELYRLLAADQLGLLDPAQRDALQEALRRHPDVDAAAFAARAREALASEADLEVFVASLAEADRENGARHAAVVSRPRPRRILRIALVAAAAALLIFAGTRWFGDRGDGPTPVFRLDVPRGAAAVVIDLDRAPSFIVLEVEVRAPAGELSWEIQDTALQPVDHGVVTADDAGSGMRRVPVTISTTRLRPAGGYWLVLSGPDGTALGQWRFETE